MSLTREQIRSAQRYGDVTNTLTLDEIAKEAGKTVRTLYTWRQIPEWIAEAGRSTEKTKNLIRGPALQCIMKAILTGDTAAARTALQVTGDIGSGVQVHTNIYQSEKELANRIDKAWGKNPLVERQVTTENSN